MPADPASGHPAGASVHKEEGEQVWVGGHGPSASVPELGGGHMEMGLYPDSPELGSLVLAMGPLSSSQSRPRVQI